MEYTYRREYKGLVKLVILDWAGTTMDYGCYAPAVVFIEVYKRRGIQISMEQARKPMGLGKKDHIRAIARMEDVAALWRETCGQDWTEDDIEDMFTNDFKPLQLECIANYSKLIPGTLEAVDKLRQRGIKIGSTTGYFKEAVQINLDEAKKQGYVPDATFCPDDVPAGRPEPWLVMRNMEKTRVYPPEAVVKVGDTLLDMEEGLNAGVWTIGLSKTGNEVGLNEEELAKLPQNEVQAKIAKATENLCKAGAHYVVESIAEMFEVVLQIERRLRRGEKP